MTELRLTDVELVFAAGEDHWHTYFDSTNHAALAVRTPELVLSIDPGQHPEQVIMSAAELDEWRAVLAEWINTAAAQAVRIERLCDTLREARDVLIEEHRRADQTEAQVAVLTAELEHVTVELERALHEVTEGAPEIGENETIPYLPITETSLTPITIGFDGTRDETITTAAFVQRAFDRRAA